MRTSRGLALIDPFTNQAIDLKQKAKVFRQDKKELFLNAFKCFYPELPPPVAEYTFHPTRKWRFDYCWPAPDKKLAVEIEGAVFIPGKGHSSGSGITKDIEKYNAATLLGFRILRFTTTMLRRDSQGCCQKVFTLLSEKPL